MMWRHLSKYLRFRRARAGRSGSGPGRDSYALIFVKRLGPNFIGFWRVRDGPAGRLVLFLSRDSAVAYAEAQLGGRRGQVIHE
jgi:hypothetical protein